jgi:dimethylamine monooxygenase subunit A
MTLDLKPGAFSDVFRDETFRDDFTYRNSPAGIRRFPFPFDRDDYSYAVNLEPHVPGRQGSAFEHAFDVDEHYAAEMTDRAKVLADDPLRCQSLPHMRLAGWDLLELIMVSKARDYPQWFGLTRDGDRWHWINRPLGIEQRFTFLDDSSLPCGPFEYITRQTQGDFSLQDERDGTLWMDAGMITSQADWSLDFDIGMNFHEWHAPVPLAHETGVFDRALQFLLRLQHGAPVRRFNWTMTVNPLLDTSPETYPQWGPMRTQLTPDNMGRMMHLRVELQALFRLPRSNAIAFSIRCYLGKFEELVTVPKWGRRLHRVVRDIHPELAAYKGFLRNRDLMVAWLSRYDDGAPTSPGGWPDAEC